MPEITQEQYDKIKHLIEKEEQKIESLQCLVRKNVFFRTVTYSSNLLILNLLLILEF